GEAERLLDMRQRDVDDRRVEDHHQLRGGDDGERQAEVTPDRPARGYSGRAYAPRRGLCGGHANLLAEGRSELAPWPDVLPGTGQTWDWRMRWPNGSAETTAARFAGERPCSATAKRGRSWFSCHLPRAVAPGRRRRGVMGGIG